MQNETDSKILAGLAAIPNLVAEVHQLQIRLNSIEKKLDQPRPLMPSLGKRVLSVKDAAEELGVSTSIIYRLIYKDQLKPIRGFGRIRFLREEIERFISRKR